MNSFFNGTVNLCLEKTSDVCKRLHQQSVYHPKIRKPFNKLVNFIHDWIDVQVLKGE